MKKNFKKLGLVVAFTMGLTMLSGCGDKKGKAAVDEMVDKYAAYCVLPEYKGIEYTHTQTTVTEDMVQAQIDNLLSQHATSTQVTEGVTKMGDTANIDFVGSVDGVEFQGGSSNGAGYDLVLGSGTMIDGFEEQIIGHEVGETFDIYVTFPEDYGSADLAGQYATFSITINYITQKDYPDYTDEFIAANTTSKTVAEYEENLRTSMEETYASNDESYNKSAVMTAVIEASQITEYPQKELEDLVNKTITQVSDEAASSGYTLETYVTVVYGMASEEAFKDYVQGLAEDYVTEKIVVCSVAKAENISVTEEEIEAYRTRMMESYGITDEDEFAEYYTDEDVAYYALAENVVDFLLENGTPVEATTEATE